jgi:hypothetical protein
MPADRLPVTRALLAYIAAMEPGDRGMMLDFAQVAYKPRLTISNRIRDAGFDPLAVQQVLEDRRAGRDPRT